MILGRFVAVTFKPGETFKETARRVRPDRVNQWPNSMLARWWWWWWWWTL